MQKTGDSQLGELNISFDLTNALVDADVDFSNAGNFLLLLNGSADFSVPTSGYAAIGSATVNGKVITFDVSDDNSYPDLDDGMYFTLAYPLIDSGDALSLEKTAVDLNGAPLQPGDEIEYTVTVTNALTSDQAGVVITDAIPANTTYVAGSAQVSQGSVSGPDPLVADIGTLAAGASATLTFRVTVDDAAGETIQNSAQASSPDQPDPIEVGPIEPDGGGLVLPSADLAISQSIEIEFFQTIFTIEVDNNGPNAAPGTVVSVTFPVGVTDITWTCVGSGGAVCPAVSGSGNTINETMATFPANGTVTYTVKTTASTSETNLAEVIPPSGIVDPDMANNTSEQVTSYIVIFPVVFTP